MDITTRITSLLIFLSFFTNDSVGLTITLSSTPTSGILGQGGLELRCSYVRTTEIITGVFIEAKINGDFKYIAKLYPPLFQLNASYPDEGKYLQNRTTLTNPGGGLSESAVLTFNRIECEDEKVYRCHVTYAQDAVGEKSTTTNVTVKGNPADPDTIPIFTPSASIEEKQSITFTCTGNIGKPPGSFRWIRIRGTQEQEFDSVTETAVVMPETCTFNGTSTFTMVMTPEDKDVVIRCQVVYDNAPMELLYKQTNNIDVYYSVRGVTVTKPPNAPPSYAEGAAPINLTCTAQGNPAPTSQDYTWFKESNMSEPIGSGPTYSIQNVIVNETDNYVCVVRNTFNGKTFNDSDRTHIKIDVSTTPAPTTTTSTSTANPGIPTKAPLTNDNEGIGIGAIAGIVVGCVVIVIIVIVIILFLVRRDRSKDTGSSIDEPPEKPRNNLSFIDKPDALGDKNGPFNNQIHYADLSFEDRPRSRKPLQLSQDSDLDHTPYAQVMMPRV